MQNKQHLLLENLFSVVKNKKNDNNFIKISDIYPNYPEFIKQRKILEEKIYVEHKRSNLILRYISFSSEKDVFSTYCFIIKLLSVFYITLLIPLMAGYSYNDLVFTNFLKILGGVFLSLWAFIIIKCKSYDKVDKIENEENNRKALTEENIKLVNEKREIYKKLNHDYIKNLLTSKNEFMNNLKNEYVDGISHISLYQLELLEKKLQEDIKYINLSNVNNFGARNYE